MPCQSGCLVVDVDPQDLAEQRMQVLAVPVRVVAEPAVADADVQVAVGAEHDRAAVVVPVGLVDLEQDFLARGVGFVGVVLAHAEPGDRVEVRLLGRGLDGVVDEELAVLFELRMERQAEEAFFVLARP